MSNPIKKLKSKFMSLRTSFSLLIGLLCSLLISSLAAQEGSSILADRVLAEKAQATPFEKIAPLHPIEEVAIELQAELEQAVHNFLLFDYPSIDPDQRLVSPAISFDLGTEGSLFFQLELLQAEVVAEDFSLVSSDSDGRPLNYERGLHYRGMIRGNPNSMVAISLFQDEIMGMINDGQHTYVLGRLESVDKSQRTHILYQEDDLLADYEGFCDTESPTLSPEEAHLLEQIAHGQQSAARMNTCLSVFLELEHDLVTQKGGATAAANFMTGLWNMVASLYQNESITTTISQIYAWTTPDNYPTGPTTGTALNAFRNARQNFPGDLAHLVSRGQPNGGGVAYLNGLCNNLGYAYSYIFSGYSTVPTYSWSVNVLAHEMGHNLGSRHTHDCVWNGNNTGIDRCGPAAGYGQDCNPPAPLPSNGGTIMSYCHLTSTGINFANGMGQQPGDLIRANLNAASCLVGCNPGNFCPLITLQRTGVSCAGDSDGSASASISGGTPPYSYAWSTGATGSSISNLSAGTYTLTVTDATNCSETATVFIAEPDPIGVGVGGVNPTGAPNGAIGLTVFGGTAPYSYQWSNNNNTTAYQNNLSPGTYNFTVTDNRGCQETGFATLVDEMPSCSQSVIRITIQADNFPEQNGYAIADDNLNIFDQINQFSQVVPSGGLFTKNYCLTDGCYAFAIVDFQANGICNATSGTQGYYLIEDITNNVVIAQGCNFLNQERVDFCVGPPLSISTARTNVSCNGANDGSASVTASDGTGVYTYSWSNGSTSASISGLSPGQYSVTVSSGWYQETASVTIIEPNALSFNTSSTPSTGSDGTASAFPSGGQPPYTFLWNNGGTTATISSLAPGTYSVTVTDAYSCTATTSVTVADNSQPIILSATSTDISCNGFDDGTANVTASGGSGSYSYLWSNSATTASLSGLSPGTYSLTVSSGSQTATTSVNIVEPTVLSYSVSSTASTNGSNGSATVAVSGGTPPYTYSWNSGGTTDTEINLAPGTYTVDVFDANGCTDKAIVVVADDSPLLQLSINGTDASCNAANDGTASVVASGSIGNYSYLWSNGATTATVSNLNAASYSVTVTSGAQTATASVTINEPAAINLSFSSVNTSYGFNSGIATVSASNGQPPYSYLWSNSATTASINNLAAGLYTVTVTDANGCSNSGTVEILLVTGGLEIVADATPTTCYSATDGSVMVTAYGGDGNYIYNWSNGATTATVSNLGAGTYFVTVTSAGQTNTGVAVVNEPPAINLSTTSTDANNSNNGTASVTANDGVTPYTYAWSNGGTTATISNLAAGTYGVTVTDANGCTATTTVVVNSTNPQLLFEYGAVFNVGDSWQTISLNNSYTNPVVIATPVIPTTNDDPVVTRVRNATGTSFELRVQQPGGSTSGSYSVQYFVVEEGSYDQATYGIEMEAVLSSANRTAARSRWGNSYRESRSYLNSYQNPVILGQVMSENDQDWSVFWASADNSRTNIPLASGFAAGKHVAEDNDRTRANESIGYVVIEAGNGTIGSTDFIAGVGTDIVRGQQNSSLGYLYGAPNLYLLGGVLSSAAMDGGDGGWPVFKAAPLGASGFRIAIEEDQIRDNERSHTTEQVAYLVFGYSNTNLPLERTDPLTSEYPEQPSQPVSQNLQWSADGSTADLLLYPNPALDHIRVRWSAATSGPAVISITNLNGKAILSWELETNDNGRIDQQLPLEGLLPGVYFLQLTTKDEQIAERFIVGQ